MLTKADAAFASVGAAADDVRALASVLKADADTLTKRYETLGTDATASIGELREAVRKMSADVDRLTQRTDALARQRGRGAARHGAVGARPRRTPWASPPAACGIRARSIYGPPEGGLGPGEKSR